MTINNFFEGLKVVELASVLAGPAVGMFFAELGAEVIKFENKATNGDVTRSWKLATEVNINNESAYFHAVNWGKQHVFVDFRDADDVKLIQETIEDCDVVIANFRGDSARKNQLDYTLLSKLNPKLIYCNLTGYGENSDRPAYDIVLQAETGYLSMTGLDNDNLCRMPVAFIDILAAHQMKEGILLAYIDRLKTGKGQKITVSLFDTAIASLANQATNWLIAKHIPKPMGCQHPNIAPYGDLMYCKDGKQIVLAIGANNQFEKLLQILDLNDCTNDIRFKDNDGRVANRSDLIKILQAKFLENDTSFWMDKLLKVNIPAGIVRTMDEVFSEPAAQKLLLRSKTEGIETQKVKTVVFQQKDR